MTTPSDTAREIAARFAAHHGYRTDAFENQVEAISAALTAAYARGIEDSARVVECLLPEQGAGGPQDATDRLIDEVRRSDASAIRALGEAGDGG